jgi:hypothetical protein
MPSVATALSLMQSRHLLPASRVQAAALCIANLFKPYSFFCTFAQFFTIFSGSILHLLNVSEDLLLLE